MIDEEQAKELGRHWHAGWNSADVPTIMAPFAENIVFHSPFVSRYTGGPSRIEGRDALQSYVTDALQRRPGIRYTLDATYVSTDSLVLVYTVHLPEGMDQPGADSMRVDEVGKVVEWRSHYNMSFRP